jgi:hypothetical protein
MHGQKNIKKLRNTKFAADMTVNMTALVLSWGELNLCVVQQTSKAASLMAAAEPVLMIQEECLQFPPSTLHNNISLQPPLFSHIGWSWCDHYVIRLLICLTNVPWEAI